MKTAIEAAFDFFQAAISSGQDPVINVDLHEEVARVTGQSRSALHGTLDGNSPGSVMATDWYLSAWEKVTLDNGRTIHRRRKTTNDPVLEQELKYDSKDKWKTYRKIMELYLPTEGTPRMLTLAGVTGICVQTAMECNPRTIFTNIERRAPILRAWQARKALHGIETQDYKDQIEAFVQRPLFQDHHWSLANIDAVGYASTRMETYLTTIRRLKNVDVVIVTAQHMDGFRGGSGTVQDVLRLEYAGVENPHVACITDWMEPDYEMIDFYGYVNGMNTDVLVYKLASLLAS